MSKEKLLGLSFREKTIKLGDDEYLVKEMNAELAEKYESSLYKIVGNDVKYDASKAKTKMVLYTLHDLDGKRVFNDNDYGLIKQLPAHVVDQIFQTASNLNGVEGAEKN